MDAPLAYSTCQSCGARMLWCLTVGGKRMPLDEHPAEGGNVLIEQSDGIVRGRVLTGAELPHGGPAYVPHHRTCPAAAGWRRRRDRSRARCRVCREPMDPWLPEHGYPAHINCMPLIPAQGRT